MAKNVIKKLSGHSGCEIYLMNDDNGLFFVRKISANLAYNQRLQIQEQKQEYFSKYNLKLRAPKIYKTGYLNNLFYFDMEYVNGKTLCEYLANTSIEEMISILDKLLDEPDSKELDIKEQINFYKKMAELQAKLCEYEHLHKALLKLAAIDLSAVRSSYCHGDLTTENILITRDKQIYLIDFLDSFCNSWQIDMAKLLQDFFSKWSFFRSDITCSESLLVKLYLGAKYINDAAFKRGGTKYIILNYQMLLLNLLRIYPYAHDDKTRKFLDNSINETIRHLEELN